MKIIDICGTVHYDTFWYGGVDGRNEPTPIQIEYRKLLFLHKLMSLPSGSVSRDIFIKKLILFINDQSCATLGFIPDICKMLFKYDLHDIVNNLLSPLHVIPSKYEWKSRVKSSILRCETELWDQRMAASIDFIFFRILHPTIEPTYSRGTHPIYWLSWQYTFAGREAEYFTIRQRVANAGTLGCTGWACPRLRLWIFAIEALIYIHCSLLTNVFQ